MWQAFIENVRFDDRGLVPAIARDATSGVVLMLAWQNAEALRLTLETREAHYYSRSRSKLWKKGETSGHVQRVHDLRLDCDGDAVLMLVDQTGVACHTGHPTCFFTSPEGEAEQPAAGGILGLVHETILQRRDAGDSKSYVRSLFEGGPEAIFAKVTEEAGELVDASRRDLGDKALIHEAADLWFHSLVLLARHDLSPEMVFAELQRRFGRSGLDEKATRMRKSAPVEGA
jgi:phosphoribosyl-AMP cyclohydrolase / phosphoribosyl-ATP pyrophosphohydrolase